MWDLRDWTVVGEGGGSWRPLDPCWSLLCHNFFLGWWPLMRTAVCFGCFADVWGWYNNSQPIPNLADLALPVGTTEFQWKSPRFQPALWTIGSRYLAVVSGQEKPWFVVFEDFSGVKSPTLSFQTANVLPPDAEMGRDARCRSNRCK